MNQKILKHNDFVKYLGVDIDEKLTWLVHINKLSLQLAKHNAMLYQIHDYVCNPSYYACNPLYQLHIQ